MCGRLYFAQQRWASPTRRPHEVDTHTKQVLAKQMHSYVMGPTAAESPAVGRCVELFGLKMANVNGRHGIITGRATWPRRT